MLLSLLQNCMAVLYLDRTVATVKGESDFLFPKIPSALEVRETPEGHHRNRVPTVEQTAMLETMAIKTIIERISSDLHFIYGHCAA